MKGGGLKEGGGGNQNQPSKESLPATSGLSGEDKGGRKGPGQSGLPRSERA